ncbi:MAG: nucleoside-diphosphate sugar epimerase/dehydratase [Ignavibacteriales bacterium]|nr:nucleoside-diphosphate sugar epimerase/dehydratase [Ignavibacteriales bacterium]
MRRGLVLLGWISSIRNRHFFFIDFVAFMITPLLVLALRLEGFGAIAPLQDQLVILTFLFAFIKMVTFQFSGLYRSYWAHASVDELGKIVGVGILATIGENILYYLLATKLPLLVQGIPQSTPTMDGIFTVMFIGGARFSIRFVERLRQMATKNDLVPVVIIGAGSTGRAMAQEMQSTPRLNMNPVAFIDDDPHKLNLNIRGITVMGDRHQIPAIVKKTGATQIVISLPAVSGREIREIVEICKHIGIVPRIVPGMHELLDGSISVSRLRKVEIEDLLRREPIETDFLEVRRLFHNRKVLVTGAGGSIGSEICRQIIRFAPEKMILLGHGENSIYAIANELRKKYPEISLVTSIADVRDLQRMRNVMRTFLPEIIIHAAAHKHVPLMEQNIEDAVSNNVGGTFNMTMLAAEFNVERFLLISTDKAVNPTSVMGATKRVAELTVQNVAYRTKKPFIAVRFGNVLGSRGSVVPLFHQQIAQGGPVTVTDPGVKRYFMTIPEAVQLVLQATTMGKGGEIFMLDMGDPISIVELARDIIRLSGLQEGKDIDIIFTGLRPGEKLFEELVLHDEKMAPTSHKKIFVCRNGVYRVPRKDNHHDSIAPELRDKISILQQVAKEGTEAEMRYALRVLVPEFQPDHSDDVVPVVVEEKEKKN